VSLLGASEPVEDLVRAAGEPMGGEQLGVDRAHQRGLCVDDPEPGVGLLGREALLGSCDGAGHASSVAAEDTAIRPRRMRAHAYVIQ